MQERISIDKSLIIGLEQQIAHLNLEKGKRAAELAIANKELIFQNLEKGKRVAELIIANEELAFQNNEKEKRAAELIIANKELAFQNQKKEKRAAELIIANKELAFQNKEREKRAAELIIANKELVFQNLEKGKRAAELTIANEELAFQNLEKEKRAAELIIANKELAFQNKEKEKRAAELIIANEELVFQNLEKEKRAAELIIANEELAFQNEEKEKRAAELILANKELAFQNEEKEKRALELVDVNQQLIKTNSELEAFSYSVSHDLRAPLRGVISFTNILEEEYSSKLDDEAKRITNVIKTNGLKMGRLIDDLLAFSQMGRQGVVRNKVNMLTLVQEVQAGLGYHPHEGSIEWTIHPMPNVKADVSLLRQVWVNLISNAIKYSRNNSIPRIEIGFFAEDKHLVFFVRDNGIGFNEEYKDKLFKVFQRLHSAEEFEGTGVGLAIAERIILKHGGAIWATAAENKGATFYFSLPDDNQSQ